MKGILQKRKLVMQTNGTVFVPLGREGVSFAIIDAEDYWLAAGILWSKNGKGYASANGYSAGKNVSVPLHCLVNKTPKGFDTDHINGNRLDNRRENLRSATPSQNIRNRGPLRGRKFKGAYKAKKNWIAQITVNYRRVQLGTFPTEAMAAAAYDAAAIKYHGAFARLNKAERAPIL